MARFLERLHAAAFLQVLRVSEALIHRMTPDGRRIYFEPSRFSWVCAIEERWREIQTELLQVLTAPGKIPSFHEVSPEQVTITDDDGWKTFVFFVFGTPISRNCSRCPTTTRALQSIPGLRNAMFSILAPGKRIPPHRGPYNGLLRYHLALIVPDEANACRIDVGGQTRHWEEGHSLVFDDSFVHAVANDTAERRVVLFADFERPLPWPLMLVNRCILFWLANTALAREPIERFEQGLV